MGKVMKKIVIALLILTGVLVWDVTRESEDTIIIYSSAEQFRNDEMQRQLNEEFPDQNIYPQPDGTFLIEEPMPINEWLTGYLLSFADGLEVIEPLTLRNALKEKICLMKKKYDK